MKKQTLPTDDIARLRELAITDNDFLLFVRSAAHLGYGRMLQIIEREWYRDALEKKHPTSGVLVTERCLGFLSTRDHDDWVAGYTADPLFREGER